MPGVSHYLEFSNFCDIFGNICEAREMDNMSEVTHIIEEEEGQEVGELQEIDATSHINVIPLQFIKVSANKPQSASPQFETVVKGKYSKYYKQTYRPAWEQMPDFKGWLRGVKGQPTRAYCIYCQKTLHAHRLSLLKHTCTIRHQTAAQLHGNPSAQKNTFNVNMDDNNIQTVIVNEENILTEEEDGDLGQHQIIYATQEEMEETAEEQDSENEQDDEDDDFYEETVASSAQGNAIKSNISNPITTHAIDTTRGSPVVGLSVSLYKLVDGRWTYINQGITDNFGKYNELLKPGNFSPGRYKLHYDVDRYFEANKQTSVFPFIEIVFDAPVLSRYHFPLLLSPNTYSTYRSMHED